MMWNDRIILPIVNPTSCWPARRTSPGTTPHQLQPRTQRHGILPPPSSSSRPERSTDPARPQTNRPHAGAPPRHRHARLLPAPCGPRTPSRRSSVRERSTTRDRRRSEEAMGPRQSFVEQYVSTSQRGPRRHGTRSGRNARPSDTARLPATWSSGLRARVRRRRRHGPRRDSAAGQGRAVDGMSPGSRCSGSSLPVFWLGLIFLFVFYATARGLSRPRPSAVACRSAAHVTGLYTVDALFAGNVRLFSACCRTDPARGHHAAGRPGLVSASSAPRDRGAARRLRPNGAGQGLSEGQVLHRHVLKQRAHARDHRDGVSNSAWCWRPPCSPRPCSRGTASAPTPSRQHDSARLPGDQRRVPARRTDRPRSGGSSPTSSTRPSTYEGALVVTRAANMISDGAGTVVEAGPEIERRRARRSARRWHRPPRCHRHDR